MECVAVVVGVADRYSRRGQGPGDVGSSSDGGGRSHDARRVKAGGRRVAGAGQVGVRCSSSTRARTRYRARTRGEASVSARVKLGRFADRQGRLPPRPSARDVPAEHGRSARSPCATRPVAGPARCPPPGAAVRDRPRLPPRSRCVGVRTDAKITRSVTVQATQPQTALLFSHGIAAMR